MQSNKKLWVALVVIAVIAITGNFTPQGQNIVNQVKETFGAVSSLNEVTDGYVKINGVEYYYHNSGLAATSSVLCSIKNPWFGNFKAALVSFTAHGTTTPVTAGGMGNQLVDLATSTTPYATSSPAYIKEGPINLVAAEKYWSMVWLPGATTSPRIIGSGLTGSNGYSNNVIGVSEYLNLRVSTTTTSGTFTTYESGACNAVLMKI